jgi:hypothetical protein
VHLLPEAGSHEGCVDIKRVGASVCLHDGLHTRWGLTLLGAATGTLATGRTCGGRPNMYPRKSTSV